MLNSAEEHCTACADQEDAVEDLAIEGCIRVALGFRAYVKGIILYGLLVAEDVEALASEGDLRLDDYRALARRLGLCDLPKADVHDIVGRGGFVFGEVLEE